MKLKVVLIFQRDDLSKWAGALEGVVSDRVSVGNMGVIDDVVSCLFIDDAEKSMEEHLIKGILRYLAKVCRVSDQDLESFFESVPYDGFLEKTKDGDPCPYQRKTLSRSKS